MPKNKLRPIKAYYASQGNGVGSWKGPKNHQRMKFWLHKTFLLQRLKEKGMKADIIPVIISPINPKTK